MWFFCKTITQDKETLRHALARHLTEMQRMAVVTQGKDTLASLSLYLLSRETSRLASERRKGSVSESVLRVSGNGIVVGLTEAEQH